MLLRLGIPKGAMSRGYDIVVIAECGVGIVADPILRGSRLDTLARSVATSIFREEAPLEGGEEVEDGL